MADYSSQTVTKTRYEVTLPNPTNLTEFNKAATYAHNAWQAQSGKKNPVYYDDTFTISATEEEIVISWAGPKTKVPGIDGHSG